MKPAERAQQLQPSLTLAISAKARHLQQQGEDICSLSTGEPDFPTPPFICRAAAAAMEAGHTRYGPAAGEPSLREAIASKLQRENRLTYGPEEIMVSNGAKQALYTLFQVLLDPGDEVILPAPYWLSYPPMVSLAGGRAVIVPTRRDRNHQLGAADLAAAITPRTRLLVINSPANPTGAVYPEQALAELASRACVHTMVEAFARRRQVVLQALGSMGYVHGRAPQGAFYAFLNIAATTLGSVVFCERLLAEAGLAIVPGAAFGDDHSVRLSFATDIPTLQRGLERLQGFLAGL